jgi:hypothetical protein
LGLGDGDGECEGLGEGLLLGDGLWLGDGLLLGDGLVLEDGLLLGDGLVLEDGLLLGDGLVLEDGLLLGDGLLLLVGLDVGLRPGPDVGREFADVSTTLEAEAALFMAAGRMPHGVVEPGRETSLVPARATPNMLQEKTEMPASSLNAIDPARRIFTGTAAPRCTSRPGLACSPWL